MNANHAVESVRKFGIWCTPTFVYTENGEVIRKRIGRQSVNSLRWMCRKKGWL